MWLFSTAFLAVSIYVFATMDAQATRVKEERCTFSTHKVQLGPGVAWVIFTHPVSNATCKQSVALYDPRTAARYAHSYRCFIDPHDPCRPMESATATPYLWLMVACYLFMLYCTVVLSM